MENIRRRIKVLQRTGNHWGTKTSLNHRDEATESARRHQVETLSRGTAQQYLWSRKRNFHSKLCLDVNSAFGSSTVHISCGMERGRGRFNTYIYIYRYNLILIVQKWYMTRRNIGMTLTLATRGDALQGHLNELWFGETHGGYETHSVLEGGVQGPLDHSLETVPGTVRHWGLKGFKGERLGEGARAGDAILNGDVNDPAVRTSPVLRDLKFPVNLT